MNDNPNNPYFNLKEAINYLKFAILFTPQYGDSFLEMIRACNLAKLHTKFSQKQMILEDGETLDAVLEKTKISCVHSEPNYGVLWFFFKKSLIDNAIDIWQNTEQSINSELTMTGSNWLGSMRLNQIIASGLKMGNKNDECTFDEKFRVVYGFEQVLPQIHSSYMY